MKLLVSVKIKDGQSIEFGADLSAFVFAPQPNSAPSREDLQQHPMFALDMLTAQITESIARHFGISPEKYCEKKNLIQEQIEEACKRLNEKRPNPEAN